MSNIISNPADRRAISAALQEISDSMTRAAAERELIKEAINETCAKYNLDKKVFRRLARVHHRRNFSEEVAEHAHFEQLYETITNTTSA